MEIFRKIAITIAKNILRKKQTQKEQLQTITIANKGQITVRVQMMRAD